LSKIFHKIYEFIQKLSNKINLANIVYTIKFRSLQKISPWQPLKSIFVEISEISSEKKTLGGGIPVVLCWEGGEWDGVVRSAKGWRKMIDALARDGIRW
jgi:hypothetical protein